MLRGIKKEGRFFLPSRILLFTEGLFFFESHDITCLADSNTPTMPTIETNHHIAAELFTQCFDGFYTGKKFYILFHVITFFLKREGGFFLPSLPCYSLRNGLQTIYPSRYFAFLNVTLLDVLPGSPSRYVITKRIQFFSYAPHDGWFFFMLSSLPSLPCSSIFKIFLKYITI